MTELLRLWLATPMNGVFDVEVSKLSSERSETSVISVVSALIALTIAAAKRLNVLPGFGGSVPLL